MIRKTKVAENVDEYLSELPKDIKDVLQKLRRAIKKAAPDAEEHINYHMPAYKQNGWLVYFAAFKNHCGLFVINPIILQKFKKELEPFTLVKNGIHFTPENPLPAELVKKIVMERVMENKDALTLRKKI